MPTFVGTDIPAGFHLDCSEALAFKITDYDVSIWYTLGCQRSNVPSAQQLTENVMFTRSTEERGL